MLKIIIVVCSILYASVAVQAEVYTLWPKRKSSGQELDTFLKSTPLLNEPVLINGARAELKISLVKMNLTEILTLLKKQFPDAQFAGGGDSLLVKLTLPNGWHKRLLLVYFGDYFPILQISMTLPPKLPAPSRWPQELVITSDGVPLRYLYFPERGTWYGAFRTSAEPAQALAEVTSSLTAQGWTAATGESSPNYQGRGEIYLKKRPFSVMLVNFSEDGTATVLSRKMK